MNDTPTTRRPRFSLRELLMLMTLVAMGITIYLQWRELAPLRTEVKTLREETGKLWIEDKTKIYAIAIETNQEKSWKWRVWIPKNRKYWVRTRIGEIDPSGFESNGSSIEFPRSESNEHILAFNFYRDEKDGVWYYQIRFVDESGAIGGGSDNSAWLSAKTTNSQYEGVGRTSSEFPADSRVLLSRRVYLMNGSSPNQKLEGFQIWIEPAK